MPIFQLGEPGGAEVEKGLLVPCLGQVGGITVVHLVPINLFVFEEAIVLVENVPQCFEVLPCIGGVFVRIAARSTQEST